MSSSSTAENAPHHNPTTSPDSTSENGEKPRRAPMAKTTPAASALPASATRSRPKPSSAGKNSVATASARLAPAEIPSVVGEASGLRSTCWNSAPESASAAPASSAVAMRGSVA